MNQNTSHPFYVPLWNISTYDENVMFCISLLYRRKISVTDSQKPDLIQTRSVLCSGPIIKGGMIVFIFLSSHNGKVQTCTKG